MLSQLKIFLNYIDKYALADKTDTVLMAVSGGKDSVAMAYLFHAAGFKTAIAHCNFQLRDKESERDERFVKQLALRLNIPIHTIRFDTEQYAEENKVSIQMAARDLRYSFFEDLCHEFKYTKIAVAHHQNDAIETVLLNLIRGTGIAGLRGIRESRNLIIRPLMGFTRTQIEDFIAENNLDFVEDSSNASDKYARNKIRLKIIPEMQKLNPSLNETFRKNIDYFSELECFVKQEIDKYKEKLFEKHQNGISIRRTALEQLKNVHFILNEILIPFGFNVTTVQDLINAVLNSSISGKIFYSDNYQMILDREHIFIQKLAEKSGVNFFLIEDGREHYDFNELTISIKRNVPGFNPDFSNKQLCYVDDSKLLYPLTIRYWEQGDKFMPLGMKGFKKLSDFFIQEKIPVHKKNLIPILINGDGNIIWICGYRTDNRFKIGKETKKITTFEIKCIRHE